MENLILSVLVLVALAVMFGSPPVASLAPNHPLKPNGYEPVLGGPGFLKVHREPLDWYDALVNCRLEGGTLASPLNSVLTYSLLNITWGLPGTHVGVRASEGQTYFTLEELQYPFVRGERPLYVSEEVRGVQLSKIERWANWAVVVPLGTERCLILRPDGTLKAFYCNNKHPYVCFRNITDFNTQGFNECGTLDDGYRLYNSTGRCYKLHRVGMPWARAVLSCQAEGGSLLIIKNKAEADIASEIGFVPKSTKYVAHYSSYRRTYRVTWRGIETAWVYDPPTKQWFFQMRHGTVSASRTYLVTILANPSTTAPPHPYFDQEIFLGIYRTNSKDFMTVHGVPYNDIEGYREFHHTAKNYYPHLLCGGYWPRTMEIFALQCKHFHRYICEKKP